jgi:hypothetical protein
MHNCNITTQLTLHLITYGWGTFPKCKVGFGSYHLIHLGPLYIGNGPTLGLYLTLKDPMGGGHSQIARLDLVATTSS